MSHTASLDDALDNAVDTVFQAGKLLKLHLKNAQPALYSDLNPFHCMLIIENNEQWQKLALQRAYQTICESVYEQLSAGVAISSLLNPSSATIQVREPTSSVKDAVGNFLKCLEEPMKGYLKEDRLPKWTLPESALAGLDEYERTDILAHLHSLGIPARSDSPQCPDMLLHNLGKIVDGEVLGSIEKIFGHEEPCMLLSTSGSGKTRTILEGLTRHWGFYFMCANDDSGIGSSDLSSMINEGLPCDDKFTSNLKLVKPEDLSTRLMCNRTIAGQHFFEILLARLAIFSTYLEAVFAANAEICLDNPKKTWLILQLKPHLGDISDIFNDLSKILYKLHAPKEDLAIVAQHFATQIFELLHERDNDLIDLALVMDESQAAAVTYDSGFMSGPDIDINSKVTLLSNRSYRPVLREIVREWLNAKYIRNRHLRTKLIITGTGLEKDAVKDAIASSALKGSKFYTTYITDSLDDRHVHRRYIEEYFPRKLLQQPVRFEHLFDRIRHWLRGRYRFTAEYISLLLRDGFRRPHTVLNCFINAAIGCQPTDMCEEFMHAERRFLGTIPEIRNFPFDFSRLTEMKRGRSPLVANLIQYVYKYFMTSMPPFAFTAREIEFVKHGFARYTVKTDDVVQMEGASEEVLPIPTIHISEPLILLALTLWANRNHDLWIIGPLHYVLTTEITNHDVVKGNGLEKYVAYYFATVLARKEGCRLGEILHFHGRTKLMNSTAKLVAVNVLRNGRDTDESIDDYSSATILNKLNVVPPAPTKGDVISEGAFISCTAETNVPDLSHCTSVLGRKTQQPEEVLNWLLFRHRNAICFPDNHFGPDLIFVLKLLDPEPTYIWVVVQCKLRLSTKTLSKKSVQDSLNTLAPTKFYVDKNREPYSPQSLPMLPERTLEAMSFLPHRNTELAGPYSVLRVICPFPAPVELNRIPSQDDEEDEDEDDEDIGKKREEGGQSVTDAGRKFSLCTDPDDLGHPLATLNIEKMINAMDQFIPENKLAAILGEKGQKVEYAAALANKRAIALDKEARQYIDQRKLTKAKGINEAVKRTRGSSKKRIERKKSTAGTAKDGAIGKADTKRKRKSTVSTRQPAESGSHALSTGNAEKKRKRTTSANSVAETELAQRNAGTMKLRTLPQKSRRP
ncbi:MAG: hypothetical protein NXY57DRAFT_782881 [Lentinula lateritia]|nr:MAG: hypothetical protein NXY57DRAFT_782881 [Lentinula lateritia]